MWCGIIHVLRYGLRWVDAPPVDGHYKTLYNRFRRWLDNGGFQLIFSDLARSDGSEPEEILMLDATYRKAHRPASSLNKGGEESGLIGPTLRGGVLTSRLPPCGVRPAKGVLCGFT